jgi:hypothetical protein
VSESLEACQLVQQEFDQFSTTYHSPTKSLVLHYDYSLDSLLSTLPFIHPICSPVSQLIGASTDMMHDYGCHASLVLSWRLPVSVKLFQSRQWDQPEGAGLTRNQSMKKIAKRIKGIG